MEEEQQLNQQKKVVYVPAWFASAMLLLTVFVLMIALYLQFTRYKLVSKAIDMRDTATGALLLSPEIATGLAKLL